MDSICGPWLYWMGPTYRRYYSIRGDFAPMLTVPKNTGAEYTKHTPSSPTWVCILHIARGHEGGKKPACDKSYLRFTPDRFVDAMISWTERLKPQMSSAEICADHMLIGNLKLISHHAAESNKLGITNPTVIPVPHQCPFFELPALH